MVNLLSNKWIEKQSRIRDAKLSKDCMTYFGIKNWAAFIFWWSIYAGIFKDKSELECCFSLDRVLNLNAERHVEKCTGIEYFCTLKMMFIVYLLEEMKSNTNWKTSMNKYCYCIRLGVAYKNNIIYNSFLHPLNF